MARKSNVAESVLADTIYSVTDFQPMPLSAVKILRLHGYRDLGRVSTQIREAAREAVEMAGPLLKPAGVFRIMRVDVSAPATVRVEDGVILRGVEVARLLRGAEYGAVFVATIGIGVEHRAEDLHRAGDYLRWLLLDTAGTLAVHLAISRIRAHVARIAGQIGSRVRGRIGPGHGDWPLQDQAALFSLFDTASLPVRLLDKGLMMPGKSMSGLMALTPFPWAASESVQEGSSGR